MIDSWLDYQQKTHSQKTKWFQHYAWTHISCSFPSWTTDIKTALNIYEIHMMQYVSFPPICHVITGSARQFWWSYHYKSISGSACSIFISEDRSNIYRKNQNRDILTSSGEKWKDIELVRVVKYDMCCITW